MKTKCQTLIFWAPRVLVILLALFVSLFALDVFGESKGFWKTALALLIHLIPTALLLILLAVSWRLSWAGAILFPLIGLWYLGAFWGVFHLSVYLIFSGVPALIGLLFLADYLGGRTRARAAGENHTT
jgi:hypothetical protein